MQYNAFRQTQGRMVAIMAHLNAKKLFPLFLRHNLLPVGFLLFVTIYFFLTHNLDFLSRFFTESSRTSFCCFLL